MNCLLRNVLKILVIQILLCLTYEKSSAQERVSGHVTDQNGLPLVGAAVIVEGTSTGVITDLDGAFTLNVTQGMTAVVSMIGYEDKSVVLHDGIKIVLNDDVQLLEEVVVVGYGVQKKETLSGAIAVVKDEMLHDKGALSSPLQALQGQVPGVIITRASSAPGDENWSMSLRGAVSANNAEPLVIIDGVASDNVNDLRLINSSDIESMSFLKDGAASIYGSRAAGGVVLITTKKGAKGRPRVDYAGTMTIKTVGRMPELMTLDEWAASVMKAYENDGDISNQWYSYAQLAQQYKGRYIDVIDGPTPLPGGFSDVAEFVFDDSSDWLDSLFGNSYSTSHDLGISGGTDRISYRLSLGYLYDGSPLKYGTNSNQRYNLRLNNTFTITNWLSLESVIAYSRQEQVAPTNLNSMLSVQVPMPGLPLFSSDGKAFGWGSGSWNSPAAQAEFGGSNKLSVSTINISETIKARLAKFLDFNVNLGYNRSESGRSITDSPVSYYNYTGEKLLYQIPTQENSYYEQTSSVNEYYSFSAYLNGHHKDGEHNVSITAGGQYEFKNYSGFGVRVRNIQNGLDMINGSGQITFVDGKRYPDKYQIAIASLFGRANYGYASRYLVELNMRYDGSSKFLPENRWSFFWSGSLAWRIGKEKWLEGASGWLSELKLRVSYGEVGNQNGISNYDGVLLYNPTSGNGALVGSDLLSTIVTSGTFASLTRTWERVHNYNFGLDFGFWDNRLTGVFEVFLKKNNNMLVSIDYPSVVGDNPPTVNQGRFKAWGYEGQIQWRDDIGKGFSYHVGGIFTFAKNTLVDFGGAATIKNGYVSNREGYPLRSLFGLRYAGKIQTEEQRLAYLQKYFPGNSIGMPAEIRIGDNMFCDSNNDGKLTEEDYVYLGSDTPQIQFSFSAGVVWKGIDLSVIFQGAGDRTMWNGVNNWTVPMRAVYCNTTDQSLGNVWSPANPYGHYPPYTFDSTVNNYNYQASSWAASDGSYIRLKNLSLGYTFPEKIFTSQDVISGCRIYFSGTDLWEYSKIHDGWDPEAKSAPTSVSRYPFTRGFVFGVNMNF